MDEVTFYSYRYNGGGTKKQIYITINCKNKSFITNKNGSKYSTSKYGFSNFELKDYSELQELDRYLKYKEFKEEKEEGTNI